MTAIEARLQEGLPILRSLFPETWVHRSKDRVWLFARLGVSVHRGQGVRVLIAVPLSPHYPAQPPEGFFTAVGEGQWRWLPLTWVNWRPGRSEREGSCLLTMVLTAQTLLARLLRLSEPRPLGGEGSIFWHGTSLSRAHSILVWGFQPQGVYGSGEGRIYFAPVPNISWGYATSKGSDGSGPALLECWLPLAQFRQGQDYDWQGNYLFFRRPLPADLVVALHRVFPDGRRQRVVLKPFQGILRNLPSFR